MDAVWPAPIGLRPEAPARPPSHFGYAYERLAPPPKSDGKADADKREVWLNNCQSIAISPDYAHFFKIWKDSFDPAASRTLEVAATSRLLVGHGNPSGADVGLTVHHTWGVPMIPGSALKGVLAHYIDAVYGDDPDQPDDAERREWRGPTWKDGRVAPEDQAGKYFAALFGAPMVTGDPGRAGLVTFHDALYVPGSIGNDRPFARDVLTVHQKVYYDDEGTKGGPTDWDDPNPVGFITVRRKARFLLTLTGPAEWTTLAMELLGKALATWGAGGKTSAGYGRFAAP